MIGTMRSVSVSHLKAHLSENLRYVKSGESLMITDRGRPVAVVQPLRSMDSELEELVMDGVVRPPTGELGEDFWELPRPADPEGRVLQALLDERREGW